MKASLHKIFGNLAIISAIAFAPENAVPRVRRAADVILPDNDSDTIAALIGHLCRIYPDAGGKKVPPQFDIK